MIAQVLSSALERIVVDTNVVVAALISVAASNRKVLRFCLEKAVQPLMGQALYLEYEDVLNRPSPMDRSPLDLDERQELLEAFFSVCRWVNVYYGWRPNLPDEGDNHLIELAVAGSAECIVTSNTRDFRRAELKFPAIRIIHPADFERYIRGRLVMNVLKERGVF